MSVYSYHQNFDKKGNLIRSIEETEDESLYDLMSKKKQKLITEIKNEKIVNPFVLSQADDAIENLKKKSSSGRIGRIKFYSCFVKGKYYYLHKIMNGETFRDSVRLYSIEKINDDMLSTIRKDDTYMHRNS